MGKSYTIEVKITCECGYFITRKTKPRSWKCPRCVKKGPKPRKTVKKSEKRIQFDRMVEKWSKCVKILAGHKSEISGNAEQQLNSHHILGKANYWLRFSLRNGICLSQGEHFSYHYHRGKRGEFERRFKEAKGSNIYVELEKLVNRKGKPNMDLIEREFDEILKRENIQESS